MAIDTTKITEPSFPAADKRARKEEKDLSRNRRNRQDRTENFVHYAKLVLIFIFVLVFVAAFICRVLHLFLPKDDAWMTEEQTKLYKKYESGQLTLQEYQEAWSKL